MTHVTVIAPQHHRAGPQAGFSLIEVSIVTAIVLLLAIIAIPAVGAYVIENKVPKVGEELARFVLQTQINAQPGTDTPYTTIKTVNLANAVRDSGLFTVSGSGESVQVQHGLGNEGTVTVDKEEGGAEFSLTLSKVNHAACPALASVMQRVVRTIKIGAGEAATPVKNDSLSYNAVTAESACEKGDVNTFVFTIG